MSPGCEPVWITGVGAVTTFGHTFDAISDALLGGRSAVKVIESFDVSQHPSQIAAQVESIPCPPGCDPVAFSKRVRLAQCVEWCCRTALMDAGLWDQRHELRIGLALGLGVEWMQTWEFDRRHGGQRILHPELETSSLVGATSRSLGLRGPAVSLSAACASGNHALALGRQWLRLGWVDCCLAGACDMGVTPVSLAGFGNLRALSRRNDQPTSASRPFDRQRDGMVLGEGGAVFVLESQRLARRRRAVGRAEVAGFGASSDAFHMVIPGSDPVPGSNAMRAALTDARVTSAEIDYINAHATSTPVGDACETRILQLSLGDDLPRVPISSTKSMTGHLLSAASAIEALACVTALSRQAVPATINLHDPDPQCALCHVPNETQPRRVRVTASNSFGFGGSNTCLVLRAVA
ncbi:MAG TPA: beta-ketoacyl-[acyl-carrier-protein] synthase family protein [Planctomycetaceae bacterium]|nr:beta-ketoacyl-[acyl-carrier-protein] synthase family protein [Planctomycetaceae bacterium]